MGKTSFINAAYQILKQASKPLSPREITSIALSQGLISTLGKTPSATMSAQLYVDIKKKGDGSRFVKADRCKFGLREWSTAPVTTASPFRPLSFKDAAYRVLKTETRPLPIEDITAIALKKAALRTGGKTPSATMGAQLYVDIKTQQDKSPFVQLGKNRFGLREWGLEVIKDEIEKAESDKILPVSERKRSIVGDPINFEGLIYGPLNENGVIFLFSKIHDKLGINIEAIQASFPDAKGRRKTAKGLRVVCGSNTGYLEARAWITEKVAISDTCELRISPNTSVIPNLGALELAEALVRVIPFAAGKKDERPVLKCIRFAQSDGKLTLTSADGYRIAEVTLDFEDGEGEALIHFPFFNHSWLHEMDFCYLDRLASPVILGKERAKDTHHSTFHTELEEALAFPVNLG